MFRHVRSSKLELRATVVRESVVRDDVRLRCTSRKMELRYAITRILLDKYRDNGRGAPPRFAL
jgi:hypothetical protein